MSCFSRSLTFPRVNRDRLMDDVSFRAESPVDFVSLSRSLPARSTKLTFPYRIPCSGFCGHKNPMRLSYQASTHAHYPQDT